MNEYVLYKGKEILAIGTVEEIGEITGTKIKSLYQYGSRSYLNNRSIGQMALIPLYDKSTKIDGIFKEVCFASAGIKSCSILTEKNCYECKFYKTIEQLDETNIELLGLKEYEVS